MAKKRSAIFKAGIMVLATVSPPFSPANAVDNTAANKAAIIFGQFGVTGLELAGRTVPAGVNPFAPSEILPAAPPLYAPPVYRPVCWTQYVTAANGNTLVPYTFCR
ncbi:MAG: hypothetical protein J2P49_10250 [Methylocapsa sp.]|nr:hypothetical protein [Methylocapsa sp.]